MAPIATNTFRGKQTTRPDEEIVVPVKDDAVIVIGAAVVREAGTAYAIDGVAAAGNKYLGVALEEIDNTNGGNGSVTGTNEVRAIRLRRNTVEDFAVTGGTPKAGDIAYLVDNNTVSPAPGAYAVVVGRFTRPAPSGSSRWYVDTLYAGLSASLPPSTSITDFVAITGGQSPTEAEFNELADKVNDILAVLRAHGLIATPE